MLTHTGVAPGTTAGACGVMPAVLLPYAEKFGCPDERLVEALFVAAGFGAVIATRASISGAEAGCQAEIGSAAAMSAAALVLGLICPAYAEDGEPSYDMEYYSRFFVRNVTIITK